MGIPIEPSEKSWKVTTDQATFDRLKCEESFWCLVALARMVNTLRFVHLTLLPNEGGDSPAAILIRYNSFLFNCALVAEGKNLVDGMHKHFGCVPEFQDVARVLNSKEARDLLKSNLFPLRKTLVFHFDTDEVGRALAGLNPSEPCFVYGIGTTQGQSNFGLADLCAMRTFAGSGFPGTETEYDAMKNLLQSTTKLTIELMAAAEKFLVFILGQQGWELQKE